MPKTREEIKKDFQTMLTMVTPENQARASEILTGLSDEFETILTESENSATRVQELTANNESLRSANMKLFLKVGETEKQNHSGTNNPGTGTPKEEEKDEKPVSFDTLFNDKGELL